MTSAIKPKSFFETKEFNINIGNRNEYYAKEVLKRAIEQDYPIAVDFYFGTCFGKISNRQFPQIILDNMMALGQDPTDRFEINSDEGQTISFSLKEVASIANDFESSCLYLGISTNRWMDRK